MYFYGPGGILLSVVQLTIGTSSPWLTVQTVSNRIYFGGMVLGGSTGYASGDSNILKDRLGTKNPGYPYGTDISSAGEGDDFATYWKDYTTGFQYAMNRYGIVNLMDVEWDAGRVPVPVSLYRGHRFPAAVISQVVWLYFRFSVSYREVEEMMARRGVQLTYETVRQWCDKFGPYFAEELRRRNKAKLGSKWHLDEVFLKIKGVRYYLWRAVDQNGAVIDILVQPKRDGLAAERFFRKLLRRAGRPPRVIVTDKLRSYGAAKRNVLPHVIHR